jgi:Holliday junction resolvase-like predicted endonuclease|tara:strand:+ start:320 stop:601 length:282 start_codon:yes stop_codon:yes gene_type:complete
VRFHEHIKGDKAECIAAMWLWDQGYLVCKNMSQQGPVDLVAIKEDEVILIDVKSECRRKRDGYKINRSLTSIQKVINVKILNVNVETGECTYV